MVSAPLVRLKSTALIEKATTVIVLEQALLASLVSVTTVLGSTEQAPPARGFTRVPAEVPEVPGTVMVMVPPAGMVTEPPDAVQERSKVPLMVQAVVPVAPPPFVPFATAPYVALVLGRLSERTVCPVVNVALTVPPLVMVRTQLNGALNPIVPLPLFVLATVRSAAVTVTVFEQVLLASLSSVITPAVSTLQTPAARGLTRLPVAFPEVTGIVTVIRLVPVLTITVPPEAVQTRLLVTIEQEIVPVPVTPAVPTTGVPYVAFVVGRLSVMIVCVSAKVPLAEPPLLTLRIQLNGALTPTVEALFVLAIVKSGAVTVTVLEQVLLASLNSAIRVLGSTEHWLAVLGLTRLPGVPPAVTGTVMTTVLPAPFGITTEPPDAEQERSATVIVQAVVPLAEPVLLVVTAP